MLRIFTISLLAIGITGCATTKSKGLAALEKVEIRAAEIVESETFDANATHLQADKYYADGDFQRALVSYKNTLIRAPQDFDARLDVKLGYADSALALSGTSEKYLKNAKIAFAALGEPLEMTEAQQSRLLAGQVLLEIAAGESEDAEVRLNEALEVNLHDPRLWNALGQFHVRRKEWVLATETYVKAMEAATLADYPLAPVINNMGMSYLLQGRSKDALKKFDQAHKMNAEIPIYDNNRRLALILTGRLDKAVKGLNDKRAAQIYNDAGYVLAMRGQNGSAKYYYKKAIELSPIYFEKAELNLLALSEDKAKTGT